MCLPPVEEINSGWTELEKKVAGNPSENGERLHSAPFNTNTFLPYTRPNMKFYRSTTSEFSISAPKCQDSFKSILKVYEFPLIWTTGYLEPHLSRFAEIKQNNWSS